MDELPETRQSIPDIQSPPSRHVPHPDDPPSTSRGSAEEASRLSTASAHSSGRDHPSDPNRSSTVTDNRFSESSRSDQSQGEQNGGSSGGQRNAPAKDNPAPATATKRFRMPRLKRNRGPMFPLPPKPTTSALPANSRPGMIGPSVTDGPPRTQPQDEQSQDHTSSPMPSPTRPAAGLAVSKPPPLSRNESGNSIHSAASSSSHQRKRNQPESRTRSSTMDSVTENPSAAQQTPFMVPSNRTSTSTSGRKSFGDLFSFPQRLRQNSEPPTPYNGSSGSATPTKSISYPERQLDDTPASYLARMEESVPKGVIAGLLAQSGDEFNLTCLRKCMRWFSYFGDPIDMAIRKLLMEMELPKETQQIDRFLQAFADRYHECNPGIFASPDQAYFIAFSILILHTDVFNKNNKRKMQKPDYVKNTRGEGIADDILECLYENISYTPFIRIEDSNPHERHLPKPRRPLFKSTSSEHLSRSREPVDPYALILDSKLDLLRPSLKEVMELEDTYDCNGSEGPPDMHGLHCAFAKTGTLQIVSGRSRPDAFMPASLQNPADSKPGLVDIKVAKVGLLWRKEQKKKRGRSPWQEWGALLTFSQLYLFRDVSWVKSLMSQGEAQQKEGRRGAVVFKPPITQFNPDALMSTDDSVTLLDSGYKKHKHAFVFVRHNSLEEVFLANNDADMNDWIAKLNYASAFRTTGVRTKPMIANGYDTQRNRMDDTSPPASADQEPPSPNPAVTMAEELVVARQQLMLQRIREANEKLFVCQKQLDDLLRNARHLQIMTPVHARAREQVVMAAGRMAAKLKWVRQDIWRTKCHREILVRDLAEDGVDVGSTVERKKSVLHLQIPEMNQGTVASETTDQNATEEAERPTADPPAASSPEKSCPSEKVSLQPVPADDRRPSLAVSFTSSEYARRDGTSTADYPKEDAKPTVGSTTENIERKASVLSSGSKLDVSSLKSQASKLASQTSIDDNEERVLREAGLLDTNYAAQGSNEAEQKAGEHQAASQDEHSGRVRRSLHRSLRDSHHGSHSLRNKKTRNSVSSQPAGDEEQEAKEDEVLPRKTPSFNFHGRKASVVTFGSEWQKLPAEERLKLRKPTPSDGHRASDAGSGSVADSNSELQVAGGRPQSMRSTSTAAKSYRANDDGSDALGIIGGEDETAGAKNDGAKAADAEVMPSATAQSSNLDDQFAMPPGSWPDDDFASVTTHQEKAQTHHPDQAVKA